MPRTLNELAKEALLVQDACNLSGVVLGMSRAIADLREHVKGGNDALHSHPIVLLWADKVAHLTGTQDIGNSKVMKAYDVCHDLAK